MRYIILFFLTAHLIATDEKPWIEDIYIPILSLEGGYQHFSGYNPQNVPFEREENDAFFYGSVFFALNPTFSLEGEVGITRSHAHPYVIDHFKQTAKWILQDD